MSALPLEVSEKARAQIKELAADCLRPVLACLDSIAADYVACSHPTAPTRAPGWESCLWLRRQGGGAVFIEVVFHIAFAPDRVLRAVLVTEHRHVPDWVRDPAGWNNVGPVWPVVDT